ncbi:MAG: RNA polymerase sigma factor [Solirubrobacterales bacterium]
MSRSTSRAAREDGLLIRALERGDTGALGPLLDRHLPRVYGLLRMTLPTAAEVESALSDAFCEAAERASDPLARADPDRWLASIALEQVERRARPSPPISLEERRRAAHGASRTDRPADAVEAGEATPGPESLAGISDSALSVLIRTLDLHSRQAIVLGVIAGLDDAAVARTIGCEPGEVDGLKRKALGGLAERLGEHDRREEDLKEQIAAIPYRLRPIPVTDAYGRGRGPAGSTAVVGDRVHLDRHAPEQGILALIRRAVKRLADLFRLHRDAADLDHDVGDTSRQKTPEPTPSLRPFEKPDPTPTTRGYRNPKLSPGVAVYAMPRTTPTTRRLSNRRRPLPPTER